MITFEDIQKAAATIKTTDIRGKQYAEVNQRIKAFRMLYPGGYVRTEILSNECDDKGLHVCVMRATVGYVDEQGDHVLGTGHAYEHENSTNINRTSYIENCETSCVGRALAFGCALGVDVSIASGEEVEKAIEQQEGAKKISAPMVAGVIREAEENGLTVEDVCRCAKIETLADMTLEQLQNLRSSWPKLKKWKAEQIKKAEKAAQETAPDAVQAEA